MRERGFTLIEVLVVAAIAATMTALALTISHGARPFAMQSASVQFDAAVAYARALAASSGNGATIVFTPRKDAFGSVVPGFDARVYSGRPTLRDRIAAAPMAPFEAGGDISESTLGAPPFSLFFNSAGHADAVSGAVTSSSSVANEPPCPGGGLAMTFTLSDPRATLTRSIACSRAVAGAAIIPAP